MSKLIVFDFDGTLVDTLHDIADALNAARQEIGEADAALDTVRSWIGEGMDHLIREALPKSRADDAKAHADLKARYRGQYARRMYATSRPYAGVEAMLDALAAFPLAVVSNKSEHFVREMVEHFDMTKRFIAIIGGDTLDVRKPDPRVIHHVVGARAPGETWMVGDSAVDIATGRAAGAHTIGCAYGIRGRAELHHAGAEHIVDDAPSITPIILDRGSV